MDNTTGNATCNGNATGNGSMADNTTDNHSMTGNATDNAGLDKLFLLTYTAKGFDGLPHAFHAWFRTEGELRDFVGREQGKDGLFETDEALEILDYRLVHF